LTGLLIILGALCCISVDIDAVAGWLGSYGGEDSTSDISRGMFAGTIGVRRLLRLFAKYNIKTTWYIPGHSLETFPEECEMIRDAGHEIGLHGYSHENPTQMTLEQQHAILDKTYKQLTEFCGKPPRGSVAPWWEASQEGAELMLKYGIEYGKVPPISLIPPTDSSISQITHSLIMTASLTGYGQETLGRRLITVNTPKRGWSPLRKEHRQHL
jgi:hypothetical protein